MSRIRPRWRRMAPALLLSISLAGCLKPSAGGSLTQAGMEALEKNDYQTAMADFGQALLNGEEAVPALRGQGIAYMGLARYEEAVTSFANALDAADSRMPKTVRDITLYEISAMYRAKQYSELIAVCSDLLESEESTEGCYYMGAAYLALGDTDQARAFFDRAVAASPRDYTLYLQIYACFEEQNLTGIGDEYLQQALKIQPETTEDRYHIGQIQFYLEKYDEAKTSILEPVDAKYLPALELMGEIYMAQGDYEHARAMYQSIMTEKGESPVIYNGLAMCGIAAGDYDEALSYIEQGLAMEEEDGKQQLRFNEIVAYEGKLDFAAALVKAEAYHALYPTDELGTRELAFLSTRGR